MSVAAARTDLALQSDRALIAERHTSHEIPALDGLRGLAVLLVIWCHVRGFTFTASTDWLLQFKSAAGLIGLYLFFVLSGFLLFQPYARFFVAAPGASPANWPSVRRFYARRAQRILPVYYTVLLVTLLLTVFFSTTQPHRLLFPPGPGPLTLLPLLTLTHDLSPSSWQYVLSTNTPLWSLAVEGQFYLLLPLLALGLRAVHRRLGAKGVVASLLALIACSLLIRAVAAATFYSAGYPNVLLVPVPVNFILALLFGMNGKYLELFALGMLASLICAAAPARVDAPRKPTRGPANTARLALIATLASLVIGIPLNMIWLHAAGLIPTPPGAFVGRWPQDAPGAWLWSIAGPFALALCVACVLVGAVLGPARLRAALAWRPLRLVGLISYSLYVWHALLEKVWYAVWPTSWPSLPAAAEVTLYLAMLAALGIVSYRLVERPFLQLRKGHPLPILAAIARLAGRRPSDLATRLTPTTV